MNAVLTEVTVSHSITVSNESNVAHDSKVCKNCLSEMVKAPGHNPLDPSSTTYKCQACGTEEKVYN